MVNMVYGNGIVSGMLSMAGVHVVPGKPCSPKSQAKMLLALHEYCI